MLYFLSIAALVALFAIATMTPINMGVLAFAAAFVIGGWVSGIALEDIFDFFPGNIVIAIIGITLLFGIAQLNGTADLMIGGALRLVRGKRWAIVWLMFFLGAGLMTMGSTLAVGMLAPIAMPIAKRYKIDPLLMGMMISHGVLGAAFSPVTVYGAFTNGWLQSAGLPNNPFVLYAVPLGLNFLFAVAIFLVRGRDLMHSGEQDIDIDIDSITDTAETAETPPRGGQLVTTGAPTGRNATATRPGTATTATTTGSAQPKVTPGRIEELEATGFTPMRIATIVGILALLVGGAAFQLDIGVCSMVISAILLCLAPNKLKTAVNNVQWSAVLLVSGMLTYMSVLNENGTVDFLGNAAASLSSPLLTALILCYAVAVLSAVGSSIGTIGIVLPLAAPLLLAGDIGLIGFVAAVIFAATIVDVSPLSSNGVMVLANAQVPDRNKFQRTQFKYTGYVVLVAPILAWALVVLPTSL
ncbi:SLC13 family permease [Rhodococcus jostii]|uniref:SLC13 family permease n=2 Tax=Rhodococcus TaxID=1827 RepID=A0ABU4CMY4_RHOJO|nr:MULTISPECIES: SLC13 family permease [Rhodococcus]MDI9948862.1 SLC13 family permease [Rhodococcus sp. IEGM 1305]MDI9978232.1 SLC13 family permease [Rhodococcus sp. IEGM 1307]MDV6284919.1 SLC13 family permease [Rhodococcus jostii]